MPFARLITVLIGISMALCTAMSPLDCKTGNQTLFYSPHPLLDSRTAPGFADSLRRQLTDPLRGLGYCLEEIKDYRDVLDTSRFGDNLVLQAQGEDAGDGSGLVLIALLRVRELARGGLSEAVSRPLVSLRFGPGEIASLPNILSKKISENLRSQYVADLLIRSHPTGASVRAHSGLEGRTPVEWVMPLGMVPVTLVKPGYLPLNRDIDLSAPGRHAYDLQMVRKRFYHSKFIYPAIAAGAASLVATAFKEHYYGNYQALGPQDQKDTPEAFGETFRTAKTYERLGYT
ncbi:MAG: PEGA domain-containing protein, partial [Fibrobacterota bacterium]|nr:PEGA domain-containing protein [Fibrobacterota bacterium]